MVDAEHVDVIRYGLGAVLVLVVLKVFFLCRMMVFHSQEIFRPIALVEDEWCFLLSVIGHILLHVLYHKTPILRVNIHYSLVILFF